MLPSISRVVQYGHTTIRIIFIVELPFNVVLNNVVGIIVATAQILVLQDRTVQNWAPMSYFIVKETSYHTKDNVIGQSTIRFDQALRRIDGPFEVGVLGEQQIVSKVELLEGHTLLDLLVFQFTISIFSVSIHLTGYSLSLHSLRHPLAIVPGVGRLLWSDFSSFITATTFIVCWDERLINIFRLYHTHLIMINTL